MGEWQRTLRALSDAGVQFIVIGGVAARIQGSPTITRDLDVLAMPSGTLGYGDLAKDAQLLDLNGLNVLVASRDDLIRMKLASGRPKDLIEAEILGALREEAAAYG